MSEWKDDVVQHTNEVADAQAEVMEAEYREAAKNMYALGSSDDIEVDDNAVVSIGEGGAWVQAWVWVPSKAEDLV